MSWWREKWWKYEWTSGGWDVMAGCVLTSWAFCPIRIWWDWDTVGFSFDLGPFYFCLSYWR